MPDALVGDEFEDVIGDTHGSWLTTGNGGNTISRDGIQHQIPTIADVRAEPETVGPVVVVQLQRDTPQMILLVVDAHGDQRLVLADQLAAARQALWRCV